MSTQTSWTKEALTALVAECEERDYRATGRPGKLYRALRQLMAETRQPWRADANGVPYCRYCGQRHHEDGRQP